MYRHYIADSGGSTIRNFGYEVLGRENKNALSKGG